MASSHPLLALLAAALLSASSAAGTHVVPSGGPIQPLLDVAGPGDIVIVPGGTYFETLVVPPYRDGLRLEGRGAVVIDGRPGGQARGTIVTVRSPGVTISGLTLRHSASASVPALPGADTEGHGIAAEAARLTVRDVTVLRSAQCAVLAIGDDVVVDGLVADGAGDFAVRVLGRRARVTRVVSRRTYASGVAVEGDDAVVVQCRLSECTVNGLFVAGDHATIERNLLANGDGDSALEVHGGQAVVRDNTITSPASAFHVWIEGPEALVERNRILGVRAEGVAVISDDARVLGNRVEGGTGFSRGLVLAGDRLLVRDNQVLAVRGLGLLLDGSDGTLERNLLRGCGDGSAAAIEVNGAGHVLRDTVVIDTLGPGLLVQASDTLVAGSRFLRGISSGVSLAESSLDVTLEDNLFIGNQGDALQNRGLGTLLRGNVFRNNRLDVTSAPSASLEVEPGNRLGGGQSPDGPFPAPEIP